MKERKTLVKQKGRRPIKHMTTALIILILTAFLASCASSSDELVMFRRKIGRVNMPTRQMGIYSMDTTIAQLIVNEERSGDYNFSENTRIAYETTFLTVPATLVYSFEAGGKLFKIEYFFDFDEETTKDDVENIYNECVKFFGFPDEGFTKGVYEYLNENPKMEWVKNNAMIELAYTLDEDLQAHAVLSYYRSEYSGTTVAVFKLPFCESTLGDGILSVVNSETKNNSRTTSSIVEYIFKPEEETLLAVKYTFKGETLRKTQLTLYSPAQSTRGMRSLNEDLIGFMDTTFNEAFHQDKTDARAYDVIWSGEAVAVSFTSAKNSGNRETEVEVAFSDYLN